MNLLVRQRQKIDVLEAESSMLRNVVINLAKDFQSTASNQRISINSVQEDLKEEETIHQLKDDMEIEQQNSLPSNVGQEEPYSHHVFH